MQNLHDSPARYEENDHYLRDPDAPESKPYSSKQQAANERHKRRETLYHKTQGRQVFDAAQVEEAKANGWRDTPYYHPKHPNVLIDDDGEVSRETEAAEDIPGDEDEPEATDAEYDVLLAEAEQMGIKVDKRWGKDRLRTAILDASE